MPEVGGPGKVVGLREGCSGGELGPREDGRGLFEDFVLGGVVEAGVGEGEGGRDMLTALEGQISLHASHDVRMGRVAGFKQVERVNNSSSIFIMAERQNDWIIEDSEEEDQLCATELDPGPPGAHHLRLASCQGFSDVYR